MGSWGCKGHEGYREQSWREEEEECSEGLGGQERVSPEGRGLGGNLEGDLWAAKGSRMGLLDKVLSLGSEGLGPLSKEPLEDLRTSE